MTLKKIVKQSTILILFSVFLACSIIALKDLLARKIGYSVSFETRNEIPLPSWTICPIDRTVLLQTSYNKSNVQELTSDTLPVKLMVSVENGTGHPFIYNMTDANVLKQHFDVSIEETWNIHCRVNYGQGCDACFTFNAPIKTLGKFTAVLTIQENPQREAMILQLHDRDASLALSRDFNWNQVLYFMFKPGRT